MDEDKMDRHRGLKHEGEYVPEHKIGKELTYKPDYNVEIDNRVYSHHTTSNTLFSTPSTFLSTPTPFPLHTRYFVFKSTRSCDCVEKS